MRTTNKKQWAALGLAVAAMAQANAGVTLYERESFDGRSVSTDRRLGDLRRSGFDDRASSAVVTGDRWEVCDGPRFDGRCVVLRPGQYPSLAAMGMNDRVTSVREVPRNERVDASRFAPPPAEPRITFYEREGFGGRSFSAETQTVNLRRSGFNDRASSLEVQGGRWEVCEDVRFRGRCMVLRPGRYPSLAAVGLNNQLSSVRPIASTARLDDRRYVPLPPSVAAAPVPPSPVGAAPMPPRPVAGFERRSGERTYQANVMSVRAIVGPPEQRCWVERQQVKAEPKTNVGAAVAGAVIGGILGHQVGGGRGQDLATVGGAIAGGAIGSQVGRDHQPQAATQDVKRCENLPNQAKAEMWDVTYNFRGQEHRVQMSSPPGATVTVNERGEPRV